MIVNKPRKALLAGLFLCAGCTCNNPTGTTTSDSSSAQPAESANSKLVDRGRTVYNTNCIACHNSNPKLAGSIGPDVYGSSLELLEARVSRAAYPEGYKPKRPSAAMPAMPYLKNDIPALHAFLNRP